MRQIHVSIILILLFQQMGSSQTPMESAKKTLSKYFIRDCDTLRSVYSGKKSSIYGEYTVWEFKGFSWSLKENKIIEADSMNGKEWSGEITIKARVFRDYLIYGSDASLSGLRYYGYWSLWKEVPKQGLSIVLEKKNGGWKDFGVQGTYWTLIPAGNGDDASLTCALIEGLKDDVEKRKRVIGQ